MNNRILVLLFLSSALNIAHVRAKCTTSCNFLFFFFCYDECDCNGDPCQNGGKCEEDPNATFICYCAPGYTGDTCTDAVSGCSPDPCVNGGICQEVGTNGFTCENCNAGYEGVRCELNKDECADEILPCNLNGDCVDLVDGFYCNCNAGWTGDDCNTPVNSCSPTNPCVNGGECTEGGPNGYTCSDCDPGYEGDRCEQNIDYCTGTPCGTNGQCFDGETSHTCICDAGYEGSDCSQDVDDCDPNPCYNGGMCSDTGTNSFTCTNCNPGFEGTLCQTNTDDCTGDQCNSNGRCIDEVDGFTCVCNAGWSGDDCSTSTDDCDPDPCVNAQCIDGDNTYTCICNSGWTGAGCTDDVNDCDPDPCYNGGTCADTGTNSFTCTVCNPGFEGTLCQTNTNECIGDPCNSQGRCIDEVNGFTCVCDPGWSGDDCLTSTDDCTATSCVNGQCIDSDGTFACLCDEGWKGADCSEDIDDCQLSPSSPCALGTCSDNGVNSYSCSSCPDGFTGPQCEDEINECIGQTCSGNGICCDDIADYSCICFDGYSGDNCENNIDDCPTSDPCQNGGVCIDDTSTVNFFYCDCSSAVGYGGFYCEVDLDDCSNINCNNGNCVDLVDDYYCHCDPGYNGEFCDNEIDECSGSPCGANGDCYDGVNSYCCICDTGYSGVNCEVECGMIGAPPVPALLGGNVITIEDEPWMVRVVSFYSAPCAGVMLGDFTVATAAHCVYKIRNNPELLYIMADVGSIGSASVYGVDTIEILPQFAISVAMEREDRLGDLAVLTLKDPIAMSITARPICLATDSVDNVKDGDGIIAGWGIDNRVNGLLSNELKRGKVFIRNAADCQSNNRQNHPGVTMEEGHICGFTNIDDDSACFGDDGGPLYVYVNSKATLYGITSFFDKTCALTNKRPNVFADLTATTYQNFVQSKLYNTDYCEYLGIYTG